MIYIYVTLNMKKRIYTGFLSFLYFGFIVMIDLYISGKKRKSVLSTEDRIYHLLGFGLKILSKEIAQPETAKKLRRYRC